MKAKFITKEQAQTFIDKVNVKLGYPNEANGTLTYSVPELIEVKDEYGNVTDSWYEIEITQELNEAMIKIATEQLIKTTDFKAI